MDATPYPSPEPPALPYRLIVFDWDGTLMDSIATIAACADHARRDVGLEEPEFAVRIREAIGLGLDTMARHILPRATDAERSAWAERYRFRWIDEYRERPVLFPGSRAAVERLHAEGYWLAIATGKGRAGLERDLEASGLREFFLATRTVNESPSKPSPVMLFEILEELGVRKDDALMIGDTTFDLDMAKNAGMDAVAVLCGTHNADALNARAPLACLASAADLPDWLARRAATAEVLA